MEGAPKRMGPSVECFLIHVLGPFGVYEGERSLNPGSWPPRAQSLLKLVATAPDHRRPRDEIVDLLWPTAAPEAGAANLRYTLHVLRRMFGNRDPSPILFEKHLVALNPAYRWEIDLEQLEQALERPGDLSLTSEAAHLYRGEPLIEDRYADWSIPVRERAQRLCRTLCLRLAAHYRDEEAWQESISWYERMLESDPLDEEAVLGIIMALTAAVRRAEALRRYKQFAKRLGEELGVPPSHELQVAGAELEHSFLSSMLPPSWPGTSTPIGVRPVVPTYPLPAVGSLHGRERELQDVLAAVRDEVPESSSAPRVLLIAAEAGMGKTRLLAEVAEGARAAEILTLAGGGYEQEGHLPYGPIHDALLDYIRGQPGEVLEKQLDGLRGALGRLFTGFGGSEDHGDDLRNAESERIRLFSAIGQLVERIGQACPLVLLLDDLQWADNATLQLLHYLSRQTRLDRVTIVGTYRLEELRPGAPLAQLVEEGSAGGQIKLLVLDPLSQDEISALLRGSLGGWCAANLVQEIYIRSAGNPFFALQIAHLLQESGRLTCIQGRWILEGDGPTDLPVAVRQAITRRLRGLGPDEREVLSLGAVLGREFQFAPLEALCGLDERSLFRALDAASDAHLVSEVEGGYVFAHPLLREVVYLRIPAARRALLHERAGLLLETFYGEAAPVHAVELAYHFQNAGRVHRDRAVRYLTLAGDASLRALAWSDAAAAYSSALEWAEHGDLAAALEEKRGETLKALARYDEALGALQRAAELYREAGDVAGEARATVLLALVHHFRGSNGREVVDAQRAAEQLQERATAPDARSQINAALARVYLLSEQAPKGLQAAERAVAQARIANHAGLLADGLLVRGRGLLGSGRHEDAVAAFNEARHVAEERGDLFTVAAALDLIAGVHRGRGRLLQAAEYAERALVVEEQRGGPDLLESTLSFAADLCLFLGCWTRAKEYVERGLALPGGRSPGWTRETTTILATVALWEGAWEQMVRDIEECHDGDRVRLTALLAEMDLLSRDPYRALARLEPLVCDPEGASDPRFLIPLSWAYLETGDILRSEHVLRQMWPLVEMRRPYILDVLRMEGMAAAGKGHRADAASAFARAVREAHAMPYPYSQARALYEWGSALATQGEAEGARRHLEAALAIFRDLGAQPMIDRTERALH